MSDFESFADESERLFDRAIDRKERLVQTYIIISGLLVAYYPQLSNPNISAFVWFLVTVLSYYVELSRIRLDDVTTNVYKLVILNIFGMASAGTFAYVIIDFIKHIYSDSSLYFVAWFVVLTALVARSLWLNYPEFTPRKKDNVEK